MDNKAIEARRAYQRAWRKKNPDKVKRYQEKYWSKKAEDKPKAAAGSEVR